MNDNIFKVQIFCSCFNLGAYQIVAARVVPAGPIPQPHEKARAGPGHGADRHSGRQLVQKPTPARQSSRCKESVSTKRNFFPSRTKQRIYNYACVGPLYARNSKVGKLIVCAGVLSKFQ
jgi:hypothetical protein